MKFGERFFVLVVVACLWLTGCSTHATKESDQSGVIEAESEGVSLQFNSNGMLIPVTRSGKPFEICGTDKRTTCSLFKENITITDFEPIMVMKFEHKINPTCVVYVIVHEGVQYGYYDPSDPNCAHFNKQ